MISVIVVNHNRSALLKRCLESLRGQSLMDFEVIVVDNASSDDSVEMVKTYFQDAKVIQNTTNLYFSKAYNQGMEASYGSFILCLNNDAYLEKDFLKEALFAIGKDEKIGMVSGKILREDKLTIDSTGLFLGRNRKPIERGYGLPSYAKATEGRRDTGLYDKEEYIFGVSGSCAFYRKKMLEDIKDKHGYFDERFEMYYEDLDLSWRAQKKGWKAYYTPKAIAYHKRSSGFFTIPDDLKKKYIRNRYLCMKKNDSLKDVIWNIPFILIYEIKLWGYMMYNYFRSRILNIEKTPARSGI
ncbi:MAG: glycosyltransferase family 2 protein [Candidatus Omnitrophota bacterium]